MKHNHAKWFATLILVLALCMVKPSHASTAEAPAQPTADKDKVARLNWPVDRKGLRFLWESGKKGMKIYDKAGKLVFADHRSFSPKGTAYYNTDYTMQCQGGVFHAKDVGPRLVNAIKKAGEFALQVNLNPAAGTLTGTGGTVLSLAAGNGTPYLALMQKGGNLFVVMELGEGKPAWFDLGKLKAGQDHHVLISFSSKRLVATMNARKVLTKEVFSGAFESWSKAELVIGNSAKQDAPWKGRLADLAIFARSFTDAELAAEQKAYIKRNSSRPKASIVKVEARLIECSPFGDPRKSTYPMGYAVYEWEVEELLEGDLDGRHAIRVAHWVWLEHKKVKMASPEPGEVQTLVLEPIQTVKQVKGPATCFDSLEPDFEIQYFYDRRPAAYPSTKKE